MRLGKGVLARGEICGMFHYAALAARNAAMASSYLIYAGAFEPLLDDDWPILPLPPVPLSITPDSSSERIII
jgi:ABC-type Na+ efflux pump permease subunit